MVGRLNILILIPITNKAGIISFTSQRLEKLDARRNNMPNIMHVRARDPNKDMSDLEPM